MSEYQGDERRSLDQHHRTDQWHLDKSVSLTHIFTTLAIVLSIITWAMKTDTRISVIENQILNNKEMMVKADIIQRDNMHEIKSTLIRIEAKLDGKVDK